MKSKKEIINELISSKTVRDYISKSDLSDDDLSMLILSENVWDIELIKKSIPDLQEFHFDLVCDYFAEYLHWLEKFKESNLNKNKTLGLLFSKSNVYFFILFYLDFGRLQCSLF